eukprot:SAG11_NODE_15520_length_575_cov_1.189076_1_plen_23_part_01
MDKPFLLVYLLRVRCRLRPGVPL